MDWIDGHVGLCRINGVVILVGFVMDVWGFNEYCMLGLSWDGVVSL